MDNALKEAYLFFKENAGYVVGKCAQGALELARAERWLNQEVSAHRVQVTWMDDDAPWDGDAPAPTVLLGCSVRQIKGCACCGHVTIGARVGVWGIGDPTPAYKRVVEAELASELMAIIEEEGQ